MRTLTFACTVALVCGAAFAPAHAADVYAPPPVYRAPPAAYIPPPPRYAYPVEVVPVAPPVGVIGVPQGPAYVVPQPAYQAGTEYVQSPVLLDERHYRKCWREWGQLRCAVRPHWFAW